MSISQHDFETACVAVQAHYQQLTKDTEWEDVKVIQNYGTRYLQIIRRTSITSLTPQDRDAPEDGLDDDDEALHRASDTKKRFAVVYDIVHSPTYQVPVLYLTVKHYPIDGRRNGSVPSLDEIYDLLVPSSHRQQMQAAGVMGALSMTDHPVTSTPTYFIHPCRTAEAMEAVTGGKDVTPEEYLLMWLGLVGPSVGLKFPIELAEAMGKST